MDWSKAPRLRDVLRFVQRRHAATSSEVAAAFGLSISNATNMTGRLTRLGYLSHDGGMPHPTGGTVRTYTPTGAAE